MMPSQSNASIKLLSAVDQNTVFTIDDVALNDPFDTISDIEIGSTLNAVVDNCVLRVAIRNLTQSNAVQIVDVTIQHVRRKTRSTPRNEFHSTRRALGEP